jgi:hypothetical protein
VLAAMQAMAVVVALVSELFPGTRLPASACDLALI